MKGRHSKKIGYVITLVMCAVGIYTLQGVIFTPSRCVFSFDAALSPVAKQAIKDAVKSSYLGPLSAIPAAVKRVCPAATDVRVELRPDKTVFVQVDNSHPYVRIGHDDILLSSGAIVNAKYFCSAGIDQLPQIMSKHGDAISNQSKSWFLSLDKSLLEQYSICFHDDYEIIMTDKQDQHKKIICSSFTAIDDEIKGMCQRVIDERLRLMQGTARSVYLCADIRFEKQIIVCSQKGGACHG